VIKDEVTLFLAANLFIHYERGRPTFVVILDEERGVLSELGF